jgi:hypothetical protein
MQDLKGLVAPEQVAIVVLGNEPAPPQDYTPKDGVLVWRDTLDVILFWDRQANEWCPVNSAGWAIRLKTAMPNIPVDHWAIVDSPALKDRAAYGTVTLRDLLYSLSHCVNHPTHALSQPAESAEQAELQADVADAIKAELYA